MTTTLPDNYAFDTRAVRAGQRRGIEGEHSDPIYATSSYVFADAADAAAKFSEQEPGNIYSRFTNPTVAAFERRLASLEDGNFAVAAASGMAAILSICLAHLRAGDHVVVSNSLFGSTINLFSKLLSKFAIEVSYVALHDLDEWKGACTAKTRLLFLETPSNPLMTLVDLEAVARIAERCGAILVVDNVFCTPALQRPLRLGAHAVVHSATKYLDGQGRCVGGAVVTNDESIANAVFGVLRTAGTTMSPFNAWVFHKGLETLKLRMRAHCESAMTVASWLQRQPAVERVYYPGLEDHPQHALAKRQQADFGGVVSFEVIGGRAEAWAVVDAARLLSITANLGDAKTTITHPATTTHGRISREERDRAGIGEKLLRIAVGLEDVNDIITDLNRGLTSIATDGQELEKPIQ